MLAATIVYVIVTAGALAVAIIALRHSKKSSDASSDAVAEAKRSADAAEESAAAAKRMADIAEAEHGANNADRLARIEASRRADITVTLASETSFVIRNDGPGKATDVVVKHMPLNVAEHAFHQTEAFASVAIEDLKAGHQARRTFASRFPLPMAIQIHWTDDAGQQTERKVLPRI